jgi:hypothetical protein
MHLLTFLTFFMITNAFALAETLALPPDISSFLSNESIGVTDDGLVAPSAQGSRVFVRYVCDHWRAILEDFAMIAPDTRRQYLIIASAESLPPSDYVDFLNTLCDLRVNGKIAQFDTDSIIDGQQQKHGFLACNYDNPRVAAVIRKIEALTIAKRPNNNDDNEYFTQLKSGKMKQDLLKHLQHVGERIPEVLPSENKTYHPDTPLSTTPQHQLVTPSRSMTQNNPTVEPLVSSDELRTPMWPWAVGITTLAVIALLVLKRRAS